MSAALLKQLREAQAELERYRPIIAALGIYGEDVKLEALVAKVRTFPEFKPHAVTDLKSERETR